MTSSRHALCDFEPTDFNEIRTANDDRVKVLGVERVGLLSPSNGEPFLLTLE